MMTYNEEHKKMPWFPLPSHVPSRSFFMCLVAFPYWPPLLPSQALPFTSHHNAQTASWKTITHTN